MQARRAVFAIVAVVVAAAPAIPASAATLESERPCYADGEVMAFDGAGFRPNGRVTISIEGQQLGTIGAGPYGKFSVRATLPPIWGKVRLRVVAADRWERSIAASAVIRIVSTDVVVRPAGGRPERVRTIRARGFVGATAIFAHVKRRGAPRARNIWLGAPQGACGTLHAKRRLFPRRPRPGDYTIQFDTRRYFVPWAYPSVVYGLSVFRPLRAATHAAAFTRAPAL